MEGFFFKGSGLFLVKVRSPRCRTNCKSPGVHWGEVTARNERCIRQIWHKQDELIYAPRLKIILKMVSTFAQLFFRPICQMLSTFDNRSMTLLKVLKTHLENFIQLPFDVVAWHLFDAGRMKLHAKEVDTGTTSL